jgi:hypothetical protein
VNWPAARFSALEAGAQLLAQRPDVVEADGRGDRLNRVAATVRAARNAPAGTTDIP